MECKTFREVNKDDDGEFKNKKVVLLKNKVKNIVLIDHIKLFNQKTPLLQ